MIQENIQTTSPNILLSELNKGNEATLVLIKDSELANRLFSMGMLPGISCKIIQKTISQGFYIRCEGGFSLALRKNEAASIVVSQNQI